MCYINVLCILCKLFVNEVPNLKECIWDKLWFPATLESFALCPCAHKVEMREGCDSGTDQKSALLCKHHKLFHPIAFICFLTALTQKSVPQSSSCATELIEKLSSSGLERNAPSRLTCKSVSEWEFSHKPTSTLECTQAHIPTSRCKHTHSRYIMQKQLPSFHHLR